MKRIQLCRSLLLLAGVMGYFSSPALAQVPQVKGVKPGVIAAIPLTKDATYCHLRFPAIQPRTLGTNAPKLKAATTGDIVDFYGACTHDPLGKEEIQRQNELRIEREMDH